MKAQVRKFSDAEKLKFIETHVRENDIRLAALSSVGPPLPNLSTQAKSLLKAGTNWAKKGFVVVSEKQLKLRMSQCRACEFWDPNGFMKSGRCKKCGCSTQAKLRLATERCPIGKWEATAKKANF